jgi:hypothetical protein
MTSLRKLKRSWFEEGLYYIGRVALGFESANECGNKGCIGSYAIIGNREDRAFAAALKREASNLRFQKRAKKKKK